jgi:hypothetical protein
VGEVPLPLIGEVKADVAVKIRKPVVDRRPVSQSLGCHIKGVAPPHPDHDDPLSFSAGIFKRFGSEPPPRTLNIYHQIGAFTDEKIKEYKLKYGLKRLESMDYPAVAWIEDIKHCATRKEQLREASTKIFDPKQHVKNNMFIKDEFYDDLKYPRLINSRHDVYKCRVGPLFKRIEQELFKLPMFIKKIPVAERGAYLRQWLYAPGWTYFATDFTAFETHFVAFMMICVEFRLYKALLPKDKESIQFLKDLEYILATNKCFNKLVTAWITATRMSGENNTSLGTGFSNLIFIEFAAHLAGVIVKPAVEGDDSCNRTSGVIGPEIFQLLGLNVKYQSHDNMSEMSFCGLIQDDIAQQNITNPYKVLARFGWSNRRYVGASPRTMRSLAVAKALSYAFQYPHMPIVRPFCNMVLRLVKQDNYRIMAYINTLDAYTREIFLEAFENRFKLPEFKAHASTRALVEKLFSISYTKQLEVESMLDQLNVYGPVELDLAFPELFKDNYVRYVTCHTLKPLRLYKKCMQRVLDLVDTHHRTKGKFVWS